jgi:hypothetical protein
VFHSATASRMIMLICGIVGFLAATTKNRQILFKMFYCEKVSGLFILYF